MDKNKLKVLKDIRYEIVECCARCEYRDFPNDKTDWGTCQLNKYKHLKHTGKERNLSIYRYGVCKIFEADMSVSAGKFENLNDEGPDDAD